MKKMSLLIGSQMGSLTGVNADVAYMKDLIGKFGFKSDICVGCDATRIGILARYRQLIQETSAGDAVVIYYSGHGGLAANPEYRPMMEFSDPQSRYYQFIVPTDMDKSTDNDFRGIMSFELSQLLTKLTAKTRNVTVILDCCHAARMSRELDFTPKALPRPWYVGIQNHLRQFKKHESSFYKRHIESNPDAVRLVAAGPDQSAYEYTNADNRRIGIFTESLGIALNEIEDLPVSWDAVCKRVRERVLSLIPPQRPEVEGPVRRLLFGLQESNRTGVLSYFLDGDRPSLRGGRILGVEVGDEFSIMPVMADKIDPKSEIAYATVTEVTGAVSRLKLDFRGEYRDIAEGSPAYPVKVTFRKRKVIVEADEEGGKTLIEAINASHHLIVARANDCEDILASVRIVNEKIEVRDATGFPAIFPISFTSAGVHKTVENLQILARAQAIREITSGFGASSLTIPYQLEWGLVCEGKTRPLPYTGALLFIGDRVYVRLLNQGEDIIYVSIFDVGVGGRITLLTTSEPSGVMLNPKEDYVLGYLEHGRLEGLSLSWHEPVPNDGPRLESLVVIISDTQQDLRALETTGTKRNHAIGKSSLQQLLSQIQSGGTRDILPSEENIEDIQYTIEHINFLLHPSTNSSRYDEQFLIDERPDATFVALSPKAVAKPISKVAVRLAELLVHRNRALLSADIRVDTMVVTNRHARSDDDDLYRVETIRFSGIKDGDMLPFENLLVYYGPVEDYLDFAVWISRDYRDSPSLADMLQTQLNSNEFKKAALSLATLAVAEPQAAVLVGVAGATATLVNIAYRLLSEAVGKSIGLYRTSLLAYEAFGIGKHPPHGLMKAQDFSFGYEIIDVG